MDFGEEPVTRDIVQETDVGIADFPPAAQCTVLHRQSRLASRRYRVWASPADLEWTCCRRGGRLPRYVQWQPQYDVARAGTARASQDRTALLQRCLWEVRGAFLQSVLAKLDPVSSSNCRLILSLPAGSVLLLGIRADGIGELAVRALPIVVRIEHSRNARLHLEVRHHVPALSSSNRALFHANHPLPSCWSERWAVSISR